MSARHDKAHDGRRDRSKAAAYARSKLVCHEVVEDLVALQREELSPLRAESVRQHLASCPECREDALELELASRTFAALPERKPPVDLVKRTNERIRKTAGPSLAAAPGAGHDARHDAARHPGRETPVFPLPRVASAAPAGGRQEAAVVGDAGDSAGGTPVAGQEAPSPGPQAKRSILLRPVFNPFIRVAVAASIVATLAVLSNETVAAAVGRAQAKILGRRFTEAVDNATEAFLTKLTGPCSPPVNSEMVRDENAPAP